MTQTLLRYGAPLALALIVCGGLAVQQAPAAPSLAERTEVGIGYYKINKLPAARQVLQEVLKEEPANFRALYGLGLIEYRDKQYAKAETFLKQALAVKQDPEAYLTLGAVYRSGKAFKEAEHIFRELRRDPKNAKAAYNLGMLLLERNRCAEAKAELSAYVQIDPAAKDKFRVLRKIQQIDIRLKEADVKK